MASSKLIAPLHISPGNPNPKFSWPKSKNSVFSSKPLTILSAKKAKRTGKLRYPSEKKKLKLQKDNQINERNKLEGIWRLFKLEVSVDKDPGKDFLGVSDGLLEEIAKVLKFPVCTYWILEPFSN